jgi:ATP-binding cassette subfamily C (CFTR/MRP) protein 1
LSTMILVIISRATPPMAPFLLIPIVLYLSILRSYLPASRVLTRLEGTSKGLSYTHFQSTLTGLSTIRAFGHQSRFATLLEKRLDTNLRAVFASQAVQCWLKTRLQLIGAGISSLIALIAVMSLQRGEGGVSAAMIGLALVNAQKMNGVLNLLVQTMAMIDAHVVSLERVVEFTGIASEGSGKAVEPPETWPEKGDISFCGVSARYRDGLEESLSNIELKVEAGERIGIVGRTGAGKSSLAMAL